MDHRGRWCVSKVFVKVSFYGNISTGTERLSTEIMKTRKINVSEQLCIKNDSDWRCVSEVFFSSTHHKFHCFNFKAEIPAKITTGSTSNGSQLNQSVENIHINSSTFFLNSKVFKCNIMHWIYCWASNSLIWNALVVRP